MYLTGGAEYPAITRCEYSEYPDIPLRVRPPLRVLSTASACFVRAPLGEDLVVPAGGGLLRPSQALARLHAHPLKRTHECTLSPSHTHMRTHCLSLSYTHMRTHARAQVHTARPDRPAPPARAGTTVPRHTYAAVSTP